MKGRISDLKDKKRLDILIFENGLAASREKARAVIMSGNVYIDNQKADKPGMLVDAAANIEVRGNVCPYVSRGGYKLEKAIKSFGVNLKDHICMDIGASTGGFTDCMLQNGAARVYSIDVGYGQLAWKLRTDPKVINYERTNIRYVTKEQIPEDIDFISIDVSFISLCMVLPVAKNFLKNDGELVCLIKPQFEAGKDKVGKKGVVRDKNVHCDVIDKVLNFAVSLELEVAGIDYSPVKGPEGNIEYLLYLKNSKKAIINENIDIINTVEASHIELSV